MATLELEKKRLLIQVIKKDKSVGNTVYVEKSILKQVWETMYPYLMLIIGIALGVIFE